MKLQPLFLFAVPALLVPTQIVSSAPVQLAYETRSQSANQIYQQVNPAVVTVYAGREIGSGSIVSANGLVITNNHVVRESSQVSVRTADGRRISGRVIATDLRYDLALIQLNASTSLPTVRIANGSGIQPGQSVLAIGSPYGRPGVLTQGTFSSVRGNGDLQSQVVLEPGNSGGPLLNAQGEMVGINKAILESSRGSNTGISIATSAAIARQFIERSAPGSLIATASSQNPMQPPSVQNSPGYPAPRSNLPAIATLPGNSSPQTGTLWGSPTPTPPTNSWGSTATNPTWGNGSQFNRKSNDVVVPNVIAPWQTAQTPGSTTPNYAPNYNPGYSTPESSPYGYPNGTGNVENYSTGAQSPLPSATRLGVIVDTRTMTIQQVEVGTAAANSGLQVGDRLVAVNGSQLLSFDQLQSFMNQAPAAAAFTIARNGRSGMVQVRF